jgi:hypothetical protein
MLNRARTGVIVFVVFEGLAAAGCGHPSAPLAPSGVREPSVITTANVTTAIVGSAASGTIIGWVVDTAFRPLVGARVEVLAGADAGSSTIADADGHFSIGGPFDATTPFRASVDGHVAGTDVIHSSSPNGQKWIVFYLEPFAAPVNIAGEYDLTLVADGACTDLPAGMRTRHYTATIAENPAVHIADYFSVTVHGTASGIAQSFSSIGVAGHDLGFDLSRNHNGVPTLVEELAPAAHLSYIPNDGFAGTSVNTGDSSISTSFDGSIIYSSPGAHAECASMHHLMTLTRR